MKRIIEAVRSATAARTVEFHAGLTVTKAQIDIEAGDAIDQIAGLLWLAGVKHYFAISPTLFEGVTKLEINLRNPAEIEAVAALLKKAGFPTDTNWRKLN
jgi:hypothetical protein